MARRAVSGAAIVAIVTAAMASAGSAAAQTAAPPPAGIGAAGGATSAPAAPVASTVSLGSFPDEASARAAWRAAQLPPGTRATATVAGRAMVIAPDGNMVRMLFRRVAPARSGPRVKTPLAPMHENGLAPSDPAPGASVPRTPPK